MKKIKKSNYLYNMGLRDFFKKEKRDITDAVLTTPSNGSSSTGLSFGSIFANPTNGMALSTVFRCIEIIADSIAVLPIRVETTDGKEVNHSLDLVFRDSNNRLTKYRN